MVRLREVLVFPWFPESQTPLNQRFAAVCEPVTEELQHRLRSIELHARFTRLCIPLVPRQQADDGAVHWWLEEQPDEQFEHARCALPNTVGELSAAEQRQVFVQLLNAVVTRLAPLRGWQPDASTRLTASLVPDSSVLVAVPLVFEPPLAVFIWGGGGPANDGRTRPYLERNHEHNDRFNKDSEWWAWWRSTGRSEVDMSISFAGTDALRVRVGPQKITLGRVRSPASIPRDHGQARALADRDMLEALGRLRTRLDLPPHPPLS